MARDWRVHSCKLYTGYRTVRGYLEMNLGLTLNYWVNPVKEFVNFVSKQSDGYCTVDRVLYGVNTCLVKKLNLSYFKLRYF